MTELPLQPIQSQQKSSIVDIIKAPAFRAIAALLLVIILGCIFNAENSFFSWGTHRDTYRAMSVQGILACGMTLVIITGGIDLAVGSILAVSAVSFAMGMFYFGLPAIVVVPACLLIGAACGAISGTLIAKAKMQPFIATLAMMVFARGLAKYITDNLKVTMYSEKTKAESLPGIFDFLNSKLFNDNIAVVTLIFLFCVLVSFVMLRVLKQGRYLYAIGGNEDASKLSGVPVAWMKVLAYTMSGLFCAIAGLCHAAEQEQGDPQAGESYELSAIAMVVIGGTSLNGGKGGIFLTLIGVLTIAYVEKILSLNAVGPDKKLMLTGLIIALAVLLQKNKK